LLVKEEDEYLIHNLKDE